MPKVVETLWASLGKTNGQQRVEYVKVGVILEHTDGSRYISMNRLFNYGLLPGGNPRRFNLQIRDRQPGEDG